MVASTSSGSCRTGASTGCAPAKTESPHRSHTEPRATLRGMATRLVEASRSGSFLLELLYFAGWRLDVRDGDAPRVRATRDEIELEADGARRTLHRTISGVLRRPHGAGKGRRRGPTRVVSASGGRKRFDRSV